MQLRGLLLLLMEMETHTVVLDDVRMLLPSCFIQLQSRIEKEDVGEKVSSLPTRFLISSGGGGFVSVLLEFVAY